VQSKCFQLTECLSEAMPPTINRPVPAEVMFDFQVVLQKESFETPFGLSVQFPESRSVVVKQVKDIGLVPSWNRSNYEKQVEVGDIIVDINGISGDADMMMKELDNRWIVMSICKGMRVDFTCELTRGADTSNNSNNVGVVAGFPMGIPGVIVVKFLKEQGLIPKYNKTADPQYQISPGDLIVAVNDIRKDVDAMMKQFQEQKISVSVKKGPKCDFSVHLTRSGSDMIGLSIGVDDDTQSLFVKELKEGGAVQNWNILNPDRRICLNDEIVSVNGVAGNTVQMIAEIKEQSPLLLLRKAEDRRIVEPEVAAKHEQEVNDAEPQPSKDPFIRSGNPGIRRIDDTTERQLGLIADGDEIFADVRGMPAAKIAERVEIDMVPVDGDDQRGLNACRETPVCSFGMCI